MTGQHVTNTFDLCDMNREFVVMWSRKVCEYNRRDVWAATEARCGVGLELHMFSMLPHPEPRPERAQGDMAHGMTTLGSHLWTCSCGACGIQASQVMARSSAFVHRMVYK